MRRVYIFSSIAVYKAIAYAIFYVHVVIIKLISPTISISE